MSDLLAALCLVLVIEGLWPLLNPQGWKRMIREISEVDERTIRRVALASVVIGVVALHFVRSSVGAE